MGKEAALYRLMWVGQCPDSGSERRGEDKDVANATYSPCSSLSFISSQLRLIGLENTALTSTPHWFWHYTVISGYCDTVGDMEKVSPYRSTIALRMGSKPNIRTRRKSWQIVNVHVSLRPLTPPIDPTSLLWSDAKNELFSESIRLRDRKEQGRDGGRERVDNLCPVSQGLPVPARAWHACLRYSAGAIIVPFVKRDPRVLLE